MSIVKPHKLGIIAGPGSEYFTGKVIRHLRRLYLDRYQKLSASLVKRHNMTPEELLDLVTLNDDLLIRKFLEVASPRLLPAPILRFL